MTDPNVVIDIVAEDDSSVVVEVITNNFTIMQRAVEQSTKKNDRWTKVAQQMGRRALTVARAVGKVAASVAAVASVTGPAVSGLLAAGKAVTVFGRSIANLLPLASFALPIVAGLLLVKGTIKAITPGLKKAFGPIARQFVDANGGASKFVKRLQDIGGLGIKPLARDFVRLNMPAIASGMERIAYQINGLVAHTVRWANSLDGIVAIKSITKGASEAVERLTPHLIAMVVAFGNLAGRAASPAFKSLGDILGRIVDKLTAWANNTTTEKINKALSDLSGYGKKLQQTWTTIRDIGRWLVENQGAIKHFSDVAAGAAVTLGIATGNIPAIVAGSASLIINHWSQLKPLFNSAITWVSDMVGSWRRDANRVQIAESIKRALDKMRAAFDGATKDIGPKWAAFIREIKGAWEEWAPIIELWWNTSGKATFQFIGWALGNFLTNMVMVAAGAAWFVKEIANGFKTMVSTVLFTIGLLITGAAKAFGWIPGLGPKLQQAARDFDAFRDSVNRALAGITPLKTIKINSSVYVTSGGTAAGGVDQRTGNSRNAGLSGLASWQPARIAAALSGAGAAFAMAGGGTSRTGGPAELTATVQNTVLLDGRPFRSYTDSAVLESERRSAWRTKNRRA